jgi:hypothetical protein
MKHLHIISNLAYISAGVWLWNTDIFLSLSTILLGLVSWVAHAKGGNYWKGDWIAMYLCFTALLLHNQGEYLYISTLSVALLALGLNSFFTFRDFYVGYIYIGVLFTLSYVSYFLTGGDVLQGIMGGISFAIGLGIRQYGHTREEELTDKLTNAAHSLWHVFTAAGIVLIARHSLVAFGLM